MKRALLILALVFAPQAVLAGSQVFYSSGNFVVPYYGSLTVDVYGAGGGGGGPLTWEYCDPYGYEWQFATYAGGNGSAGGTSAFGGITAYGGGGGIGAAQRYSNGLPGSPGSGSGGDTVIPGGGAAGGVGGDSPYCSGRASGGSGGAGGRTIKTFSYGQLGVGSVVGVTVGSGGVGGLRDPRGVSHIGVTIEDEWGSPPVSPETLSQPGQNGYVVISWSPPPPASCSVTFDQNPISYGGGTTMHWTSSNAYQLYIRNYGNVTPNTSGSVALSGRTSTTDFSCYAYGYGGDSGWQSATLTVNPPASCTPPWGGSIPSGQSAIAYQSSSAVYGTSCVSQTRTCSNGSLSGSYSYSSCAVQAPSNCTLAGATVANGASHDFYSISSAPAGQLCSAYAQTRTCTNGSLDGSSSYGLASCSCSPIYTCSGSTIQHVESDCSVTTVATCAAPTFCSPGGSSCRYPDPIFVRHGSDTGHLRAVPELVQLRSPVNLYWNVSEVQSCTVSGTNGDSWTELTGAQVSSPITEQTVFTLSCLEWNNTTLNESQTVNVAPVFQER